MTTSMSLKPLYNQFSSLSNTTVLTPGNFFFIFIATEFILKRRRYWPWITAPSHKCNNKLDCFLQEMLLITDSFFIKSNLQEPLKNVLSVGDLGVENVFFLWLLRDYWVLEQPRIFSTFNQQSMHQEYITNVQQRRKRPIGAFLMLFLCRKKPYGEGSKTVFREVKSHFFPDKITWGILMHPDTPNI